jgi:predicted aspartyl protease
MFGTIALAAVVATASVPTSTAVPFTLFDNRMLVEAFLDGSGPYTMIVDTGSDQLVVTPSVAHRLGLATRRAGFANGAGSGSTALALTHVPAVTLGSLRFNDVSAAVLDLTPIQRAIGFPRLDGVIGYNMLRRYRIGVDMDNQKLTFSSAPLTVPKTAATIPFTISGGIVRVPAAVDGVKGTFMIDTGDRSSLTLFRHFAEANNFYRDAPVRNVITGIGIGGPVYSDVLRMSVSLFGTTVPSVVTRASRDRGGAFALGSDAASIGTGLLKRFNIVYDYPDSTIYAWPSHFFDNAERYSPLIYDNGVLRVEEPATDPTLLSSPPPKPPNSMR